MSEYRFHLQKYKYGSKISCPSCGKPRCFVKYVDAGGEIAFPGNVGKCDHENSCGYHYTPKEYFKHHSVRLQSLSSRHCSCKHSTALDSAVYFKDNPDVLERNQSVGESFQAALCKFIEKKPVLTVPSYIPLSYVDRSQSHYEINPLYKYLCNVFGEEETIRLFQLYRIGTSVKWGGSAVFWQIDINGLVRTGKIMCYNPENGHRIKEPQAFVSWAHSELHFPDFHLKQCLFGEHLLKGSSSSPVMLVESEKTAIIMSHFISDYIWLATGGKNGCFNRDAIQVLQGRDVTLIPDLAATEQWKAKSSLLLGICKKVSVSGILERIATEEQRSQGLDIADFFLFSPSKQQILQQMIQRNPALQLLIDELGLELIE